MGNANCYSHKEDPQALRLLASSARVTGSKKAVLVGLNYRGTRAELRGCINDVNNMQKVLVEKYGFKVEDILMLNEDQDKSQWPYKQQILDGMAWLYKDAKPGDLLFFHYSGHGSQYHADEKAMPADVICPLDCIDGEWPAALILDTEIHASLYEPLPAGCKAVCLFDCCHSATVANLPETMVVQEGPLTAAKKDALVQKAEAQKKAVETQVRFYQEVNSGKLDLKKKSKQDLLSLFEAHKFPKKTSYTDDGTGYGYLLEQTISSFCTDSVKKVEAVLAKKTQQLQQIQALKVGEGAKIYVGNLEADEEQTYESSHASKSKSSSEIRIRWLPEPKRENATEDRIVKPVGTGLLGALKTSKFKDHQLWVFSGCQDDQTSADAHVDGIYQGAFTWALVKALKTDDYKENYRNLLVQLKSNLEIGGYEQVPALSTTHELYLDYGFCGKLKEDGVVIEG
mmetsp:Transcript_42686/g.76524  ORF Transcript_42686/g.76524 Transcript_42686/m.76524 type:complete len:455 (+) Transcript_42686:59-1423(+)